MSQWGYVIAAYALTAGASLWLVASSWAEARRAERDAEALDRR